MKTPDVKLDTRQRLPTQPQSKPAMTRQQAGADALAMLRADHREVDRLLEQFEGADAPDKQELAQQIGLALTVHAQIEEELLYPAAREALDPDDAEILNEPDVEHATIKRLVSEVEDATPEDQHFDALMKVIGEYVKHHVKEEESELFPKLEATDLDLQAIGAQLAERKTALTAELRSAA